MQQTPLLPYKKLVFWIKKVKYKTKVGFIIYTIVETQTNNAFAILMVSCFGKKC